MILKKVTLLGEKKEHQPMQESLEGGVESEDQLICKSSTKKDIDKLKCDSERAEVTAWNRFCAR